MSTKIYTAYRLRDPAQQLWPFVRRTHRAAAAGVRAVLRGLIEELMRGVDVESDAYKQQLETWRSEPKARLMIAGRSLSKLYRDQASSPYRNEFNLDVSLSVREHEGCAYVIPYCDMSMRKVLDFLKDDPALDDFAYWNNSDRPARITDEEWSERARVWDALDRYEDGHRAWSDYLVLEVCSVGLYWQLDPTMEMLQEMTWWTPFDIDEEP